MLKLHWIGRCNHCYMLDLYKRLDQLPLSIRLYKLTFCSCKGVDVQLPLEMDL